MNKPTPKDWGIKRLGDIAKTRRGITYSAIDLEGCPENSPLYINMKSFRKDGSYNPSGEKYFNSSYRTVDVLKKNDLLIVNTDVTPSGDILGVPLLVPEKYRNEEVLYSHHVTALELDESVSKEFIYYLLCHPNIRQEVRTHGRGTTVKMLDSKDFLDVLLPIPALDEQNRITSVLSSIDVLLKNLQAKALKLEDLKTSLLNELMTKGIGHSVYKNSDLGRIPESWEIGYLESFCRRVCVGFVGTCEPFYRASGIPLIRTGNLKNGTLDLSSLKFVTKEFHELQRKSQLEAGDLLIARHGEYGQACLVTKELGDANCLNIVIVKPNFNDLNPLFLKYLFNSPAMRRDFESRAEGSTQKVISTKQIANTLIVKPPLNEQKNIALIMSGVDASIQKVFDRIVKITNLKYALMHDLLIGKVRVPVN